LLHAFAAVGTAQLLVRPRNTLDPVAFFTRPRRLSTVSSTVIPRGTATPSPCALVVCPCHCTPRAA